jgi:tetratricopeptide (TPR) repeat protein
MRFISLLFLILVPWNTYSEEKLLTELEIKNKVGIYEGYCEPSQKLIPIGEAIEKFHAHIVDLRYRYDSGCASVGSNATLYVKYESGYKKIWGSGEHDPAVNASLTIYTYGEYQILVHHFFDGGNAGYSHQKAYVIEKNYEVKGIDERLVFDWAKSEITENQHIHSLTNINYSESKITYSPRVANKDDHYRHPAGGDLHTDAVLKVKDSEYYLEPVKSFNVGKANYFNDEGLRYYKKSEFDKAIGFFKKSISSYPRHWQAKTNLGLAFYKNGEYEKSIEISKILLNEDGPNEKSKSNASYNIGLAYEKIGNFSEALAYFEQANNILSTEARAKKIKEIELKL